MTNPIEAISGDKPEKDIIDIITDYQNIIDSLDNPNSGDVTISNTSEVTEASAIALPEGRDPNLPDEAKISDQSSAVAPPVSDIISSDDVDRVLEDPEIFQDSDGDGITDNLDATGFESQIEQAYDEDAAKASEENIRSFLSLMAMLSHLDLSAMDKFLIQGGDPQSLAVQATAGCAQMALSHNFNLQNAANTLPLANKVNVKTLLQNFQNQSSNLKVKNLQAMVKLIRSLPENAINHLQNHPVLKTLPPEKQNALINMFQKNLGFLNEKKLQFGSWFALTLIGFS